MLGSLDFVAPVFGPDNEVSDPAVVIGPLMEANESIIASFDEVVERLEEVLDRVSEAHLEALEEIEPAKNEALKEIREARAAN